MSIEFATDNINQARQYLNCEEMAYLTEETKQVILDGVEQGICRVRDPFMYGGSSGIVPETKDPEVWDPFIDQVKTLHDRDFANRPQPLAFAPGDLPDGYEIEWGDASEGDGILWWGTDEISESLARRNGHPVIRYIGPIVTLKESDHES